jgi:hypothetical protein
MTMQALEAYLGLLAIRLRASARIDPNTGLSSRLGDFLAAFDALVEDNQRASDYEQERPNANDQSKLRPHGA